MVARELAARGADVVVLERGPRFETRAFTQREDQMLSLLYDAGTALQTRDRAVRILAGRGVGGGSIHNLCLVFDAPPAVRAEWTREFGIPGLEDAAWRPLVDRVRQMIAAGPMTPDEVNLNNSRLLAGMAALGWSGGVAEHNRVGCLKCGFCQLGCAFDRIRDMSQTYLPAAVSNGARVYADVQATRLVWDGDGARQVEAQVLDRASGVPRLTATVQAQHFVIAAGAIRTPQFLLQSGVAGPYRQVGRHLRLQPSSVVLGDTDTDTQAWAGIPESAYVDEFAAADDPATSGYLLLGTYAQPAAIAETLPGLGAEHAQLMERFSRYMAARVLLRDAGDGQVTLNRRGDLQVDYGLAPPDVAGLRAALADTARLLFAAGAHHVVLPFTRRSVAQTETEAVSLAAQSLWPGEISLTSAHPQGSARMGADAREAATDGYGRVHGLRNVTVADASTFPTAVGVPPQLTVLANATRIAFHLAGGPAPPAPAPVSSAAEAFEAPPAEAD